MSLDDTLVMEMEQEFLIRWLSLYLKRVATLPSFQSRGIPKRRSDWENMSQRTYFPAVPCQILKTAALNLRKQDSLLGLENTYLGQLNFKIKNVFRDRVHSLI